MFKFFAFSKNCFMTGLGGYDELIRIAPYLANTLIKFTSPSFKGF